MNHVRMNEFYDSARRPHPLLEESLALLKYRELIFQFVTSSIKTRYKRSILGVIWTLLNPLLSMVVLTLVFANLFRLNVQNYPVYVLSGLILWAFFASTTNLSMQGMVMNGDLLKRIYVPKSLFAISAAGNGLVNLVISLIPLFGIAIAIGLLIKPTVLVMPAAIILVAIFAIGISLLISTAAVYFADMLPVYEVILMLWMYATPIIYPIDIIPERFLWLFKLNPMYHFVAIFRDPLYSGVIPSWQSWAYAGISALVVFCLGAFIFTSKTNEYAYRA
jgi:ABC-type polysaccharide/polyol phosphate export permease